MQNKNSREPYITICINIVSYQNTSRCVAERGGGGVSPMKKYFVSEIFTTVAGWLLKSLSSHLNCYTHT